MRKVINFFKNNNIKEQNILQNTDDIFLSLRRYLPFSFMLRYNNFVLYSAPFDTTGCTFTKASTGVYYFQLPAATIPFSFDFRVPIVKADSSLNPASTEIIICQAYCPGGGPGANQKITLTFKTIAGVLIDPPTMSYISFDVSIPFNWNQGSKSIGY
jgi:hypothetical protein